jgi:hypothetical protein
MVDDIVAQHVERLVCIESHVHYGESPPPCQAPFVVVSRDSRVLLSAPHGARTFRNDVCEVWHEEDEYTAGMTLLLSELCGTSAIATIWRIDDGDPNVHGEARCEFKQALRRVVQAQNVRWVLDVHGASKNSRPMGDSLVDLGTRREKQSMDPKHRDKLADVIVAHLGTGVVSIDGWPASTPGTITAYCQEALGIQAVQIEMKPSVRVVQRRPDASAFATAGPFSAESRLVSGMLQAIADFIAYLQAMPEGV